MRVVGKYCFALGDFSTSFHLVEMTVLSKNRHLQRSPVIQRVEKPEESPGTGLSSEKVNSLFMVGVIVITNKKTITLIYSENRDKIKINVCNRKKERNSIF